MTSPLAGVRPAATLVALRPGAAGLEVFFVRRRATHAFMPSFDVFPGGRVEGQDAVLAGLAPGETWSEEAGRVAALRESWEEAGLVRLRSAAGPVGPATTQEGRDAFRDGAACGAWLEARAASLDTACLRHIATWVTPTQESRRFYARFFVAMFGEDACGEADGEETEMGRWVPLAEVPAAASEGQLQLAPPTACVLWQLQQSGGTWAPALFPTEPIEPVIASDEGRVVLHLPWDEAWQSAGQPTTPRPSSPCPFPSARMTLDTGRWVFC